MATSDDVNKKIKKIKKIKVTVEECGICCEPYNKSTHLSLVCEYVNCNYKTCVACIKAYLLNSTNDAHCMECKQPWTPKFMLALTKKWTTETYREHRQKLLCEVEISKLAESMAAAENYKASKNEINVRAAIRARMQEIRAENMALQESLTKSFHREYILKNGNVGDLPPEKKVFFMSCPSSTCNGMLSTQYKCGICEMFTCPTCHELIGLQKLDHTCDPNNIASAEAIKKETRQCPGCHNRIYRTEGCSQMWCTGCHTAFDWNTGRKVISQQLHNPHWLEYQRTANANAAGANAAQAQQAGPLLCNGLCTRNDLRKITTKLQNYEAYVNQNVVDNVTPPTPIASTIITIQYMHNFVTDVTNNYVRNIRDACQALNNHEKHRIQYIVGELNKEKLALYIFRNDRLRQKNTELLHIYELLSVVGIDIFNGLRDSVLNRQPYYELVVAQVAEYNKLRLHCNGLFATISNTYNQTVSQINNSWSIKTKKFNTKTMTAAITEGTDPA